MNSIELSEKLDRILRKVQKPAKYAGGEFGIIKKSPDESLVRFAFCFPDTYEIAMSHLGMKILYGFLNEMEGVWCERAFAPWIDMRSEMLKEGIPLFALESREPLKNFDILGFTLQYELSYTNVLDMLSLSGIPLLASERASGDWPLICAGGPCNANPEPLADFIDFFVLGEGEAVLPSVIEIYKDSKSSGANREQLLYELCKVPGVYIPSLYDVAYNDDFTVKAVTPKNAQVPATVTKQIITDMDSAYFPKSLVMPSAEAVHDRIMLELFRGCMRGCRFCQAGMIYRPVRFKSAQTLASQAKALVASTGYEEISMTSLSSSDYPHLNELCDSLLDFCTPRHISLALPSLRVDNFSSELMNKIQKVRKTSLTFAPEAGTQRLRDAINKNVLESDLLNTCSVAFEGGYQSIKLYFMLGLPTETDDDIIAIAQLAQKAVDTYYNNPNRQKGRGVTVTISAALFVPKPVTPFQWEPQDSRDELLRKIKLLRESIRSKKISLNWHEPKTSYLEAVFARGDRRLGKVLLSAYNNGCIFDSWDSCFEEGRWAQAFEENGIDPAFYSARRREFDEVFPWDHLDMGVTKPFLIMEAKAAYENSVSPNCTQSCQGCGASRLGRGEGCV